MQGGTGMDLGKWLASRRRQLGDDMQETDWKGISVVVNITTWRKISSKEVKQEVCLKKIRQAINEMLVSVSMSVVGRRGDPHLCSHINGKMRPILKLNKDLTWAKEYGWGKWELEQGLDEALTGVVRTMVARHGRGVREF